MDEKTKIELRQLRLTEIWARFDETDQENIRQLLHPESVHGPKAAGKGLQGLRLRRAIEERLRGSHLPWNFFSWETGDLAAAALDAWAIERCSATDQVEEFGRVLLDAILPLLTAKVYILIGLNDITHHGRN